MRISHLLRPLVLLLGAVSFAGAQTPADLSRTPQIEEHSSSPLDSLNGEQHLRTDADRPATHRGSPWNPDNRADAESVCYVLRSYRVNRLHRNSDVVESAGYTTCVPSSRYSVKRAIAPAETSPE